MLWGNCWLFSSRLVATDVRTLMPVVAPSSNSHIYSFGFSPKAWCRHYKHMWWSYMSRSGVLLRGNKSSHHTVCKSWSAEKVNKQLETRTHVVWSMYYVDSSWRERGIGFTFNTAQQVSYCMAQIYTLVWFSVHLNLELIPWQNVHDTIILSCHIIIQAFFKGSHQKNW